MYVMIITRPQANFHTAKTKRGSRYQIFRWCQSGKLHCLSPVKHQKTKYKIKKTDLHVKMQIADLKPPLKRNGDHNGQGSGLNSSAVVQSGSDPVKRSVTNVELNLETDF